MPVLFCFPPAPVTKLYIQSSLAPPSPVPCPPSLFTLISDPLRFNLQTKLHYYDCLPRKKASFECVGSNYSSWTKFRKRQRRENGGGEKEILGHKKTTNASLWAPECYVLGRAGMSGTSPPSSFTPERLRLGREKEKKKKKGAEENEVVMIHV